MWRAALVLAVSGCGRIAFDEGATTDAAAVACAAPVGHDEDGDGVDDACDVCPDIGASQLDADGDGVGDDCDPSALTDQTRTLFDPFLGPTAAWRFDPLHEFPGDALRASTLGRGIVASLLGDPGREEVTVGGRVTAIGPGDGYGLSIQFKDLPAPGAYYCELYQSGGVLQLKLTYTLDDVAFGQVGAEVLPGPITAGPFRLTASHAPPTVTCTLSWQGQTFTTGGAIPGGLGASAATYLAIYNVISDVDYAVRLALP